MKKRVVKVTKIVFMTKIKKKIYIFMFKFLKKIVIQFAIRESDLDVLWKIL